MLRAPADAVPKVRPASPATASPVRETRMQAWKRSRTSPVKTRAAMIRANRRRRLYPGVLMAGRGWGFGIGGSETIGRASGRERVCQYGKIAGGAVTNKK